MNFFFFLDFLVWSRFEIICRTKKNKKNKKQKTSTIFLIIIINGLLLYNFFYLLIGYFSYWDLFFVCKRLVAFVLPLYQCTFVPLYFTASSFIAFFFFLFFFFLFLFSSFFFFFRNAYCKFAVFLYFNNTVNISTHSSLCSSFWHSKSNVLVRACTAKQCLPFGFVPIKKRRRNAGVTGPASTDVISLNCNVPVFKNQKPTQNVVEI